MRGLSKALGLAGGWPAVATLLCALTMPGSGVALGQTAADVQCRKCVEKQDIAKGAVSKTRIKQDAVTTDRLREGAVKPENWALRILDATGKAVGTLNGGEDAGVLIEVASGPHAGEFFYVTARRNGLSGRFVFYTLDDCMGQAYDSKTQSALTLRIPFFGWTGPHPAFGAGVGGGANRPAFFLPAAPDAVAQTGLTFESRSSYKSTTGLHICDSSISSTNQDGLPLDVIEDPDLSNFVPPFRAGTQ